jgi:hypothetical protein
MIRVTERTFPRGPFRVIHRTTVWLFWVIPVYVRDRIIA